MIMFPDGATVPFWLSHRREPNEIERFVDRRGPSRTSRWSITTASLRHNRITIQGHRSGTGTTGDKQGGRHDGEQPSSSHTGMLADLGGKLLQPLSGLASGSGRHRICGSPSADDWIIRCISMAKDVPSFDCRFPGHQPTRRPTRNQSTLTV